MDFNLTDEQQMLREGAERFLLESYTFDDRKLSLREPRCRTMAPGSPSPTSAGWRWPFRRTRADWAPACSRPRSWRRRWDDAR